MTGAYYNENDHHAAAWLRELIKDGHIAPGDVDERSIVEVQPDDLRGYVQCHFFAGIGGWSYALRLAGWPDDRPVWSGSCPCQPLSEAGKGLGSKDDRHLWPEWRELIKRRRPVLVFGEQVASRDGLAWFDIIYSDFEAAGYACGAVDLCACSIGAPHARQRLFFLSYPARGKAGTAQSPNSGRQATARRSIDAPSARRPVGLHGKHNWHTEPGICRVAHGVSANVARVSALGNAIVPQVAAEFIRAAMECVG